MRAKLGWWSIACIAGIFGGLIASRFAALGDLRADYDRAQAATRGLAAVQFEHARWLAAQPAFGEIERLRPAAENLSQARAEVAQLRAEEERAAHAEAERRSSAQQKFAVGSIQPAAQ